MENLCGMLDENELHLLQEFASLACEKSVDSQQILSVLESLRSQLASSYDLKIDQLQAQKSQIEDYHNFLDKRLAEVPENLALVPFSEVFESETSLKNGVLYTKANWDKLFLDPSQVDANFKKIMLSQNPMRLAPLNNKENFLGVKPTFGFENPNNKPKNEDDNLDGAKKSLRKAQNRENLVFSKSASKSKLGMKVKNPLEAGFTSRSKSPIAVNLSSSKGVHNSKQMKIGKNDRWK